MECDRRTLACVVCGSTATPKRCTRCRTVVYCSRDHQVKDWSSHKHVCKKTTGIIQTNLDAETRSQDNVITVNTDTRLPPKAEANTSVKDTKVTSSGNAAELLMSRVCDQEELEKNESQDNRKNKVTIEDLDEDDDSDDESNNTIINRGTCGIDLDPENKPEHKQNLNGQSKDINQKESGVDDDDDDDDDGIPFDDRPYKVIDFPKCPSKNDDKVAKFASQNLIKNGYCVIDDILEEEHLDKVVQEIKTMDENSQLKPGQLSGGRSSGDDKQKVTKVSIRNDRVAWVEGNEEGIPNISKVVDKMDMLLLLCNEHIAIAEQCIIQDRTKVF